MRLYYFIIFIFLFFVNSKLKAEEKQYSVEVIDSCSYSTIENECITNNHPNPILQLIKIKHRKNKRIVAAILAFPFPFGMVGLHRIYLGTAPHVPVVYIGTFGGILGILPFIDFCVLVLDKNLDRYQNNQQIFMWIK